MTRPSVARMFRPLMRQRAAVFMLHRLRDEQAGNAGHDPEELRRVLAYLRRERYEIVSLAEVFLRLRTGQPLQGAVAFTLDDGYADQVTVAGPVFAEFDCPATVFVTTGFVDRQFWFWWDQIEFVFDRTRRADLDVARDGATVRYSLATPDARRRALIDICKYCKLAPEETGRRHVRHLAKVADVEVPERAPPRYAPMTWGQLRAWEERGMSFGAHTVTHPILARTDGDRSRTEIVESWRRVRGEAAQPVPVFCYPNGLDQDFGEREYRSLEQCGFEGAVMGFPGFVSATRYREPDGRFRVFRFSYPGDSVDLVQWVSGVGRFKEILRGPPELLTASSYTPS